MTCGLNCVILYFALENTLAERENMAIVGIGVDICEIARIERAVEKPAFVPYLFSEEEIEYAEAHKHPAVHFAASFAAREALAKAGGWGLGAMGVKSCSVTRTASGPRFVLSDKLKAMLDEKKVQHVHLSISHDAAVVVAFVVLEG